MVKRLRSVRPDSVIPAQSVGEKISLADRKLEVMTIVCCILILIVIVLVIPYLYFKNLE